MKILDLFLNDCIEKINNVDFVVLQGFTPEQTKFIRIALEKQYTFFTYSNVTSYKELTLEIQKRILDIVIASNSGKKMILSFEEFTILAPQLPLLVQKSFLIINNPLNVVLPLRYSQKYFSELYDKGIDLFDNDDEEVTAASQFYNVIELETEEGMLFHGECRNISELITTFSNIELFPQWNDTTFENLRLNLDSIKMQKLPLLDLVKTGLQQENIFGAQDIDMFIQQIKVGKSVYVLSDDMLSFEPFSSILNHYGVKLIKVEVVVPKTYRYANLYQETMNKLLKKYWGNDATFRTYPMYRNESRDGTLIDASQEEILQEILEQVNSARNNEQYRDLFFVASTGAGKSLLYQLTSKIFHDEGMVTIVVTPLKSLMYDQYKDAMNRGLRHVTYINSDIPYADRDTRLEGVRQGLYSLLYISPEFLQRVYDIHQIIGEREVALFVVDEAHCVSSWGKDFRADYGYLGNYIARYKNKDGKFPILALTATAVYTGPLDTISEISSDLKMRQPKVYMTDVKRKNIQIDIKKFQAGAGAYSNRKHEMAVTRIHQFVDEGRKFLTYSPYKTTSSELYTDIEQSKRAKIAVYTGGTFFDEGQEIINQYKSGSLQGVIATKAFGMGVDIRDIQMVYHYAMAANLADYVQEIGRAGRDPSLDARALCDFNAKDFGFWRVLRTLSRPKQWQIKLLVRKLYEKYRQDSKDTLLLPLEWFQFLEISDGKELETNRIRQALILIERDFYRRYKFPILRVYPGEENAIYFAQLEGDNEKRKEKFLKRFGQYVEKVEEQKSYNILRFNLKEYYEQECSTEKYGMVKKNFFKGKLFPDICLAPRFRLVMKMHSDFRRGQEQFYREMKSIVEIYRNLGQQSTRDDIKNAIRKGTRKANRDEVERKTYLFTTIFSSEKMETSSYSLFSRKLDPEAEQHLYVKTNPTPDLFLQSFLNSFDSAFDKDVEYEGYLEPLFCSKSNITQIRLQLAYLLEIMEIATYTISGGQHETIKIRLLSPEHLKNPNYKNHMLDELYERDNNEYEVIRRMVDTCTSSQEYWQYIERYFLGREY